MYEQDFVGDIPECDTVALGYLREVLPKNFQIELFIFPVIVFMKIETNH